jgi:hypothetical protein
MTSVHPSSTVVFSGQAGIYMICFHIDGIPKGQQRTSHKMGDVLSGTLPASDNICPYQQCEYHSFQDKTSKAKQATAV